MTVTFWSWHRYCHHLLNIKSRAENIFLQQKIQSFSLVHVLQSRHIDFLGPTIPCGRPLPFLSQALYLHDDTSPLTSCSWGRDPVLSKHKPAQSEGSAHWQKHPKASTPMTVCDIRSDSFSITTTTMALWEDSVFVSTKHPSQSTEKKSDLVEVEEKRELRNRRKRLIFWK